MNYIENEKIKLKQVVPLKLLPCKVMQWNTAIYGKYGIYLIKNKKKSLETVQGFSLENFKGSCAVFADKMGKMWGSSKGSCS